MTFNNKILPVALVAALLGGTAGALVMRTSKTADNATVAGATTTRSLNVTPAHDNALDASEQARLLNNEQAATANLSADEQDAYRLGFVDGARTVRGESLQGSSERVVTQTRAPQRTRVVYRNATRTRYARSAPSRVYYDYEQPRKRSFWSKHRDKLTVAMGTGAGAAIGAAVGGKKGALIGGLAGAGGSALYTYKLRKRDRRY